MASRGVWHSLHLKQTYLVKTSREDIDDVAIVSRSFGQRIIELDDVNSWTNREAKTVLP